MAVAKPLHIKVGAQTCEIVFGRPLSELAAALSRYAPRGTRVMVIADSAVARPYGQPLTQALARQGFDAVETVVPAGEASKTLRQTGRLYQAAAKARLERKSWIIALGGGVVGDLAGFVAASYLRGIPYVQVPTTLLAQVDSSIGGKTGVDIPEGKNLVGAFYHPRLVWQDAALLKSLPVAHWRNGIAEVVKYAAIFDADLFATLEKHVEKLVKGYSPLWPDIIARCARWKAETVQKDPFETKGLRALLNFGHTAGHAIEAAAGYRDYLHGEAISIGMFVALFISQEMEFLEPIDRIRLGTLLTKAGLPAQVRKPLPLARILEFMSRDKKVHQGAVRFVLLKKIGEAVSGQSVPQDILEPALSMSGIHP